MSAGASLARARRSPTFGTWLTQPSLIVTEAFARSGMDWVVIDLQHTGFDFRTAAASIQVLDALGVESFVRLPAAEIAMLPRLLDYGLSGAIIANVEGPATVAHAIANARYQPDGVRSYGGQRFGLGPQPAHVRDIQPAIYVIIETAGATATLEEIASTPGLAGLALGPGDLALSLGLEIGQADGESRWHGIMDRVLATAIAHGLEAWAWAADGAEAARWAEAGYHRVTVASDVAMMRSALRTELAFANAGSGLERSGPE